MIMFQSHWVACIEDKINSGKLNTTLMLTRPAAYAKPDRQPRKFVMISMQMQHTTSNHTNSI